jgi:hypothetical protein
MKFASKQNYSLIPDINDFNDVDNRLFPNYDLSLEDLLNNQKPIHEENIVVEPVEIKEYIDDNKDNNNDDNNDNYGKDKSLKESKKYNIQFLDYNDPQIWLLKKSYMTKVNKLKLIKPPLPSDELKKQIASLTHELNLALDKIITEKSKRDAVAEMAASSINKSNKPDRKNKSKNPKPQKTKAQKESEIEINNHEEIQEIFGDSTIFPSDNEIIINNNIQHIHKKKFHFNIENKIKTIYLKNLRDKRVLSDIVKHNLSQQISIFLQFILDLPRSKQSIKAYLDIEFKDNNTDCIISHFLKARLYPSIDHVTLDHAGHAESLNHINIPANFPIYVDIPDNNILLTTFYIPYTTIRSGNKLNLLVGQQQRNIPRYIEYDICDRDPDHDFSYKDHDTSEDESNAVGNGGSGNVSGSGVDVSGSGVGGDEEGDGGDVEGDGGDDGGGAGGGDRGLIIKPGDKVKIRKILLKRLNYLRLVSLAEPKLNNIILNSDDHVNNLISDLHEIILKDPINLDLTKILNVKVFEYLKYYGVHGWNIRYLTDRDFNVIERNFGLNVRRKIQIIKDILLFYKIHGF